MRPGRVRSRFFLTLGWVASPTSGVHGGASDIATRHGRALAEDVNEDSRAQKRGSGRRQGAGPSLESQSAPCPAPSLYPSRAAGGGGAWVHVLTDCAQAQVKAILKTLRNYESPRAAQGCIKSAGLLFSVASPVKQRWKCADDEGHSMGKRYSLRGAKRRFGTSTCTTAVH
eukprot:gene11741-biopygen6389